MCIASAKYLPDEDSSRSLRTRSERSIENETNDSEQNESNESDDDKDDDEDNDSFELKTQKEIKKLQMKYAEEQRKLEAKREKEERKREEQVEKEQRKREKFEAKIKEEERKLQEKLEKEQRKQQEKLEKEELKRAEKKAREELKRQEKIRKQIEKQGKTTLESATKSVDSTESEEDLDFEDIWRNYIYQKYGLTESSTDLEKDAAINRYIQEELSLNANSTKNEYRQAVLQLVKSKLLESNSSSGFHNYLVSHVNAVHIQKLQTDLETKIAELENDTALLQNVSLPWAPEARQAIAEEKSILTLIAQYLSDIVPSWIIGGKPVSSISVSSSPTSDTSSSSISNTESSNIGLVPYSTGGPTSESNNIGSVDGITTVVIDSINAEGIAPSDSSINVNSNANFPTPSSNTDLNENSIISTSTASTADSNGSSIFDSTTVLGPLNESTSNELNTVASTANITVPASSLNSGVNDNSLIDQSIISTIDGNIAAGNSATAASNLPSDNNALVPASSNGSQGTSDKPAEVSNIDGASSVISSTVNDVSPLDTSVTSSIDSQSTGSSDSISTSPSGESSTSNNNPSTGTEATSNSVTSDVDANAIVSNNSGFVPNSDIQTIVESGINDNSSIIVTSVNADKTVSTDVNSAGNPTSITIDVPVSESEPPKDISSGDAISISSNIPISATETNSLPPESPIEAVQVTEVNVLPSETPEVAVQVTDANVIPSGTPVATVQVTESNVVPSESPAVAVQVSDTNVLPTGTLVQTVQVAESNVLPSGNPVETVQISESNILPSEAPVVAVQVTDANGLLPETPVETVKVTESNVLPSEILIEAAQVTESNSISSESPVATVSVNTNKLEATASITEVNVAETTDFTNAPITTSELSLNTDTLPASQGPAAEVQVSVVEATNTSESVVSKVVANETTVVNNAIVIKDVSVVQPEEVANTPVPKATQSSLSENKVPTVETISSEPTVDSTTDVNGELSLSTVNDMTVNGESATVSSANVVDSITTEPFQTNPLAVETPARVDPELASVTSDSAASVTAIPANDVTLSNGVTLAPESKTLANDAGLISTGEVIFITEVPQAAQYTNTPFIPEEVGASILEVTQQ